MIHSAKTLFQLQADLVDSKVDKAVNQAINQVVEQIVSLRQEMHRDIGTLRHEMNSRFSSLENRMVAVETRPLF